MPSAPCPLRILFYTPFKPLGHGHPSGDLITARGLIEYLAGQGHQVLPASSLRCRWIYWKPWLWPKVMWERRRLSRQFSQDHPDLWFTYHTYYKAPDLLGPFIPTRRKIPYVIFQGIYATKRKKKLRTWPGYILNKKALGACQHVFTNKRVDLVNLPHQRKREVHVSMIANQSHGLSSYMLFRFYPASLPFVQRS